jgi:hypothetical protein
MPFFGGEIRTAQGILNDCVAQTGIGRGRTTVACPHTDRPGFKRHGGCQHGGKMQSIGRTHREAVVGAVGGNIQSALARQAADLRGYLNVAMGHMHIAAPLDDLKFVFDAQAHDLCRRKLAEGNGNEAGQHNG